MKTKKCELTKVNVTTLLDFNKEIEFFIFIYISSS